MGLKQVKKLEAAAAALTQEAREIGRSIPQIQLWLVSTGGFTPGVITYVNDRDTIYLSGYDDINEIFRAYGGNYRIPVFTKN